MEPEWEGPWTFCNLIFKQVGNVLGWLMPRWSEAGSFMLRRDLASFILFGSREGADVEHPFYFSTDPTIVKTRNSFIWTTFFYLIFC